MDIDQSAMCYTSMDSSRQALQCYESFFEISESFFELMTIFQNNSGIWFMQANLGRYLC